MKRRLLPAALVALALSATACDVTPTAATVQLGSQHATISQSHLLSDLQMIAGANPAQLGYAACVLELQGATPPTIHGVGDGTVTQDLARFQLNNLVFNELVHMRLAATGHSVTAADLDAARADLLAQLSSGSSPCQLQGQRLADQVPTFIDREVTALAEQEKLVSVLGQVDLSPAGLEAYYQAHPSEFQLVCLSAIVVNSQAQAAQIRQQITSGQTTFETAAATSSIDTQSAQSGGQLGCTPISQVQNQVILGALNGLNIGDISQPVSEANTVTGQGDVWILLKLDSKPVTPLSQAASQIRQELLSAHAGPYNAEMQRVAALAKVSVNPQYGSWSTQSGVVSPVPPPARQLLDPFANIPASTGVGGLGSGVGTGTGAGSGG
ncbi:MAG TPA: peptidylprolyl isomerase [Acidimicrobiales bacterium]|nr:peptidylprolyl isomerase [Acidimicrobiales bacterium]